MRKNCHCSPSSSHNVDGVDWSLEGATIKTARFVIGTGNWVAGIFGGRMTDDDPPEVVFHTGVVVYNCVYEYLDDKGVKKTRANSTYGDPGTLCDSSGMRNRERLGSTRKCEHEFDEWVSMQRLHYFRQDQYNKASNNCIDFAIKSCEFLGVPVPHDWQELRRKARNYKKLVNFVDNIRGGASSTSSSSSS